MIACDSAAGCERLPSMQVTVLAPTGETITTDTGTDPVLGPVLTMRLCETCSRGLTRFGPPTFAILGGHLDFSALDPEDILEGLDPITMAKAAVDPVRLGAHI